MTDLTSWIIFPVCASVGRRTAPILSAITTPICSGLSIGLLTTGAPLFALADAIGSDWPDRIRQACADLMPSSEHADSADTLLLADIKAIFDDMGTDRLSSEQTCEALVALEGRPWEIRQVRKANH